MPNIIKKHTLVNYTNRNINVKYIVEHDTGVKGQSAKGNANYFYKTFRGASAHYFVDKNDIYEVVSAGKMAWHVGDDRPGDKHDVGDKINNNNTVGIEMCAEKDGTFHANTIANTAWLTQKLMKDHNVPASHVVRHYDASGKNCPQFMNTDGKWTLWKKYHKQLTGQTAVSAPSNGGVNKVTDYTIKAGDTLWGISKQYNATVAQLKEWNNLNDDNIIVGQTLKLKADNKPTDNPVQVEETTKATLKVDGYLGKNTITELQRYFKTPIDGVISKPSTMVKELQKLVGAKADGYLGKETITKMQQFFGTPVDGELWEPSTVVKEVQRRLNKGDLGKAKPATTTTPKKEPAKVVETKPKENLKVDGYWGVDTTKALQRYFGTPVDGEIWGQVKNNVVSNIGGVKYGKGGSKVVKDLQKLVGVKQDGYFGKDTLKALQKHLGTPVDGVLSRPSTAVKELQRRLNKGKL